MDCLLGFLSGSGMKLLDDIFDIYGKDSVNVYVLELLHNSFIMMLLYVILSTTNYFMYVLYFCLCLPIIIFPKAYTVEPFWATLSILGWPIIIYKLINNSRKPIILIILFCIIFYSEWGSAFFTEIGEVPARFCLDVFQTYFPKVYSFFWEKEDMEISKKKLIVRSMNVVLCIFMLLYGNQKIVSILNIEDNDFISILPITSWFILGYNLTSVMNQSYMIYYKKVTCKTQFNRVVESNRCNLDKIDASISE